MCRLDIPAAHLGSGKVGWREIGKAAAMLHATAALAQDISP